MEMAVRDTDQLSGDGHHVTTSSDQNRDAPRSTKPFEASHTPHIHASQACDIWKKVQSINDCGFVLLDGYELDVASLIAVAK
jgi:phenylalanine ammonia-lyase